MSIEAMKQALAFVEANHSGGPDAFDLMDTLRTAIEQAEKQEPVTTIEDLEQEIYENTRRFVSHDVMEWMLKRYYTAPQSQEFVCSTGLCHYTQPKREWVGLTQEDIDIAFDDTQEGGGFNEFAQAIEKTLRRKNS